MADVLETLKKLPAQCALTQSGETFILKRGVGGYFPAPDLDVHRFNTENKATPRQVAAMEAGSIFGWEVPAADPDNPVYDKL